MKVIIEVELDDCYQEQIFKNTVYDQRNTNHYTEGLTEHSLRALLEQVDGQADPSFHKYNSDKEDIRIETKVDLLRMCELNGVTVKVKL